MKNFKLPSDRTLLQIVLIIGIILLTLNDKDGWGWLIFILVFMN